MTLADGSDGLSPRTLFDVPATLTPGDARGLLDGLEKIFGAQIHGLRSAGRDIGIDRNAAILEYPAQDRRPPDVDVLVRDLEVMRAWFDPVAKGERVREAVSVVPEIPVELPFDASACINDLGRGRRIVTPEGRALMSCLRSALSDYESEAIDGGQDVDRDWVRLRDDDVNACTLILLRTYRRWTRRRLEDVVGLLTSETSTLRPAAAGLLLTLLINRNTDAKRALPRPTDKKQLEVISQAIAGPAAAYATTLAGSKQANMHTFDLYRGWPLGELTRRLGPSLHTGLGSGIYLEPGSVDEAVDRLIADIRRRPLRLRSRVFAALKATLDAYESRRPQLAGLGLAFESPAQTERLLDRLRDAASESPPNSSVVEGQVQDPSPVRSRSDHG